MWCLVSRGCPGGKKGPFAVRVSREGSARGRSRPRVKPLMHSSDSRRSHDAFSHFDPRSFLRIMCGDGGAFTRSYLRISM